MWVEVLSGICDTNEDEIIGAGSLDMAAIEL